MRLIRLVGFLVAMTAAVLTAAGADTLADVEHLFGMTRYEEALEALERVSPSGAKWHFLASKIFDQLQQPTRAAEEAHKALQLDPGNEAYHLHLGQVYLTWNNPEAAQKIFGEALRLFPESPILRLANGLALNKIRRFTEAEGEFLTCLELSPALGLALDGLMEAYLSLARYAEIHDTAARYGRDNPKDFRVAYYTALAGDRLNDPAEQLEEPLRRAIALNPSFVPAHALLGKVLLRLDRPEEAALTLEGATRLRWDYRMAYVYLGQAYRRLGRKDEAKRALAVASELAQRASQPQPSLRYQQRE